MVCATTNVLNLQVFGFVKPSTIQGRRAMRIVLHTHFDEYMKLGRHSIAELFGNEDEMLRGVKKLLGIGWTLGNTR